MEWLEDTVLLLIEEIGESVKDTISEIFGD